jgi:putative ubiquitin-RnfH superfamily antitoxin RatB of RatAB toxin-antitoxin module
MRSALRVEVVYALAGRQDIVVLEVPPGTLAGEAVRLSRLPASGLRLGIGGKAVPESRELRDGDRIDLLRPLAADPKEARRRRAKGRKARR